MNQLMRYLGIIAVLVGVIILGLYYLGVMTGNGTLITAGIIMVLGLIGHIILNKIFVEK